MVERTYKYSIIFHNEGCAPQKIQPIHPLGVD